MNTVYVLIHARSAEDGECIETMVSAHPTAGVAESAERFFRSYGDFKKHDYENTYIQEVEFTS